MTDLPKTDAMRAWWRLRRFSWLEGMTLLLLLLIAVPLKRLAGLPVAVSIMGPIHGAAFIAYVAIALWTVRRAPWRGGDAALLILVAFVPFGAWMVGGLFGRRRQQIENGGH